MKISEKKIEKISEQILALLFEQSPKLLFTSHVAVEIARDEEFVKRLLLGLKAKMLVKEINKNPQGIDYKKRSRWTLTSKTYETYKKLQK